MTQLPGLHMNLASELSCRSQNDGPRHAPALVVNLPLQQHRVAYALRAFGVQLQIHHGEIFGGSVHVRCSEETCDDGQKKSERLARTLVIDAKYQYQYQYQYQFIEKQQKR